MNAGFPPPWHERKPAPEPISVFDFLAGLATAIVLFAGITGLILWVNP